MTEALLGVTGALYGWLLTYLLHSTILLMVVWVLVHVHRVRRPLTQDLLWKAALLGGLLTATVTTLRDAPRRRESTPTVAIRTVRPADKATQGVSGPGIASWLRGPITARGAGPAVAAPVTRPSESCRIALTNLPDDHSAWPSILGQACPSPRAFLWQHALVFIWLFGALFTGIAFVWRWLALQDALGLLEPAGPRSRMALERVSHSGWRIAPALASSEIANAPCVVRGRVIVLPRQCEEQLSDEELDAVVAHELAHVQRRDDAWLFVLRALEAVFWIQPLNRVGVAGSLEATELECDDRALARTGRPLGLARSLARVAEWTLGPRPRRSLVALVQGKGHRLSERVRRILASSRPDRGSPWTALGVAALLMAPVFMLPSVPAAPVVRRDIVYELDAGNGTEPTLMLLSAVAELEEDYSSPSSRVSDVEIGEDPDPRI